MVMNMKKKQLWFVIFGIVVIGLIVGGFLLLNHNSTTKQQGKQVSQASTSSTAKNASSENQSSAPSQSSESSASVSSKTVRTSEAQSEVRTKARQALYEAGIDSSSISDEQIVTYWDEAKAQKVDFVEYVQAKLK